MKALKLLVSPAALCVWAVCLCIAYSVAGSDASRIITLSQETEFGSSKASFPSGMKRWDEPLFLLLSAQAKSDMAEFLRTAGQDAAARPLAEEEVSWKPHTQSISFVEQFRALNYVSYLEIDTAGEGNGHPIIGFKTVNYDKAAKRELVLGDIIDGAADRSKALETLANYARSDLREQTQTENDEADALLQLARPDLIVYERFTLCPSTKADKAAGLTIHFPPSQDNPYDSDFHVTIPYTVFSKFVRPQFKALFAGEPRQAPVSIQNSES